MPSDARNTLWPKVEAPPNPFQHDPCDGDLSDPARARAFGVDDDPRFIVDEIFGVVTARCADSGRNIAG